LKRPLLGLLAIVPLAIVVLLTLPLGWYRPEQIITSRALFDNSWHLALPVLLTQGEFVGWQRICSYGVLYQVFNALGLILPSGGLPSLLRWFGVVEVTLVVGGLELLLRGTGAPRGLRYAAFIAWSIVLAAPVDFHGVSFKPMMGLVVVAGGAWLWANGATRDEGKVNADARRGQSRRARLDRFAGLALWFVTPGGLTLYSFEFGLVALLAQLTTCAFVSLCTWRLKSAVAVGLRRTTLTAATCAVGGAVMYLAATLAMGPARRAFIDTLALASGYPTFWSFGGVDNELALLLLPFVAASFSLPLMMRDVRRACASSNDDATIAAATATGAVTAVAAIGGILFGLVCVRDALTRSDIWHIWRALAPSLFVYSCYLPCWWWARGVGRESIAQRGLQSKRKRHVRGLALTAWISFTLAPWVTTNSFQRGWLDRLSAMSATNFTPARIVVEDPILARALVAAGERPERNLVVWPYGSEVGLLSGKQNHFYFLEPAGQTTSLLDAQAIGCVERTPDLAVLLLSAVAADELVPPMLRTPGLFRYLLENFELAPGGDPVGGFTFLERRASVSPRWQVEPIRVDKSNLTLKPAERDRLVLPLERGDCRATDLYEVRVRAAPTSTFGIGKPGRIVLGFVFDDGTTAKWTGCLPLDGQFHELLICPVPITDERFASMFHPRRLWRSRARLSALVVAWAALDRLTVTPESIDVEGLSKWRKLGVETLDSSLDDPRLLAIRRWSYAEGPRPD
jgi:hypothetical protein